MSVVFDLPDQNQGLPGLTAQGKTFFETEFRGRIRERGAQGILDGVGDKRQLQEDPDPTDPCICSPVHMLTDSAISIDLRHAPVFQVNAEGAFGTPINPVNRDTAGDEQNPTWERCGHFTGRDGDAWWGVDLGKPRRVQSLRLQNRADCCPWRLEDVKVYLGATGNTEMRFIENSMVAHDLYVPQHEPLSVAVNATGRFLFLRRQTAGGHYSGMTLCEIEVFE